MKNAIRLSILGLVLILNGCQPASPSATTISSDQTIRIYSTVTEATVNAVIEGFSAAHPETTVELFRAPTAEVAARIATELRDGGLQADVLWLTDPLSMHQYEADGLLRTWTPSEIGAIPAEYRTETFFGTRLLNMVIVAGTAAPDSPTDWDDLTTIDGGVAIPDPAFAGSAFATLAYFANTDAYGLDFYQRLLENGAVQVQAPADVVTGVAEGIYTAGITLDQAARSAIADGSPLALVWPESGAIAIYSPIAVVDTAAGSAAENFVDFVLTVEAQEAIAGTGWQPIRADVAWDHQKAPIASIDWSSAWSRQQELLDEYAAIFAP